MSSYLCQLLSILVSPIFPLKFTHFSYLLACLLTYLHTYFLTLRNRVLLEKLTGSQLVKKLPAFYGTRRFITLLQVLTTCPHLETDPSSTYPTTYFLKIHLNIILPSTPGSPKWSLSLQVSPSKPCIRLSSPPYALHAPPIPYD